MALGLSLLFVSAIASGCLYFFIHSSRIIKYVSVFGGAFLMAICFTDMLPEAFSETDKPHLCSAFVLFGFIIQLIMELISHGGEHGHLHHSDKTSHQPDKSKQHNPHLLPLMILIGISIHAFFEAMALNTANGINKPLLIGIIIHNIPVSLVIVGAFAGIGASKSKSILMLSVFAAMGVAGGAAGHYSDFLIRYSDLVICFVVGILLHVAVSTLFDSASSHRYNLIRFLLVIAAFGLAFLIH